ncbi:hypothetical protein [Noviherbaspirillum pedocola]|uniref:Uncharacterized protein n=1 Tax=Noviherbaspirillum pedocola TaxID=2801341 RepID=A0A934T156_9BURK|nr:hypothetical protein [Noviherbaspirillum pedocola]MBK4739145.1 hypothetical protein [Noviherbaspirillum pedocola]
MYYKKPHGDYFELVAVNRIYVLQHNGADRLEVILELADGAILKQIYTRTEYADLLNNPPRVIV